MLWVPALRTAGYSEVSGASVSDSEESGAVSGAGVSAPSTAISPPSKVPGVSAFSGLFPRNSDKPV